MDHDHSPRPQEPHAPAGQSPALLGAAPADAAHPVPTLHGPRGMCVRAAELSAVREDAREVDFIMSTGFKDSYGEVVRQNWRLERFTGNPVALWAHDRHSLPIGQWLNVRVEDNALRGTLKVASEKANPLAECVWQSILERTIRAVSVGFVPGRVIYEEIDGEETCILDDNELMECSPVPIPANPEALIEAKARAKAAFIRERSAPAPAALPATPTPSPPSAAPTTPKTKSPARAPQKDQRMDPEENKNKTDDTCHACGKGPAHLDEKALQPLIQKRADAIAEARVKAAQEEIATLRAKNAELEKRGLDLELSPLVGVKVAPEEVEGILELGAMWLARADGRQRWEKHLAGITKRADIAQRLGGSVLPPETPATRAAQTSADSGDELAAMVNGMAHAGPALLSA